MLKPVSFSHVYILTGTMTWGHQHRVCACVCVLFVSQRHGKNDNTDEQPKTWQLASWKIAPRTEQRHKKKVSQKGQRSSCAPLGCLLPGRIKAVSWAAGYVTENETAPGFQESFRVRKSCRESSGDFLLEFWVTMPLGVVWMKTSVPSGSGLGGIPRPVH